MKSSKPVGNRAGVPDPPSDPRLGGATREKRLAAFCTKHGYSGRCNAAELLARLRAAPAGTTDEALTEALRDAVLAQVAVLQAVVTALKNLGRSVVAHLGEHPDAEIFTSLPRSGQINAAQVLAEWGDARAAYASPWATRTYSDARDRGHDHPHAVRILARAWIRVIYRCWTNHEAYNPARHGGYQRLTGQDQAA